MILGILRDKDIPAICRALEPLAARFLTVPTRNPRAASPEELRDALAVVAPGVSVRAMPGLDAALAHAPTFLEPVLVAGSFFLVGEALARLTGQPLPEESWQ